MFAWKFTPSDVDLERKLLDPSLANCELDEDTLQQLVDTIGDKRASIASLPSFSTAEIEQIRKEKRPAQAMLQKLKEKGILTHEELRNRLQTISLLNPTIWVWSQHFKVYFSVLFFVCYSVSYFVSNLAWCLFGSCIQVHKHELIVVILVKQTRLSFIVYKGQHKLRWLQNRKSDTCTTL